VGAGRKRHVLDGNLVVLASLARFNLNPIDEQRRAVSEVVAGYDHLPILSLVGDGVDYRPLRGRAAGDQEFKTSPHLIAGLVAHGRREAEEAGLRRLASEDAAARVEREPVRELSPRDNPLVFTLPPGCRKRKAVFSRTRRVGK